MKKILGNSPIRRIIQAAILILVFALALGHQYFGVEKVAPIDAYCPFGAVEGFFTLLFKGEFLKRIFSSVFILLGIFLVATLVLGRVFCGYFCPLGALQEGLRFVGQKIGLKKSFELPPAVDKYFRYLKYFVLAVIIYFSFYLNDLIFRNYDPYNALMHLGEEFDEKIFAYAILFTIVVISLFTKNWWCRYFCPLGAFLAPWKKIGLFKVERNAKTCISCGLCNESCPAGLEIATVDKVRNADCISCGKCVGGCPENSLKFTIANRPVSLKKFLGLIGILVVLPLIIFPLTPLWQTKPESNLIDVHGEINVKDLRGSNTLEYVIEKTGVPLGEFQSKLGLPADVDLKMKLKEIGPNYNLKNAEGEFIETEEFRQIIEEYLSASPKTAEPVSAIDKTKEVVAASCPFGETDCEFPGDCPMYVDTNANKICDRSE